MPVIVRIPTPLRKFTQGKEEVQLEASTVQELMEQAERLHPGLRQNLCDEQGRFRRFVNVYLNGEDIRFLQQEATPVKDGDELSLVPAIAGGR